MSEENKKNELAQRGSYEPTRALELSEQIELLKTRFGLPPTMIETHYVRLDGKYAILRKRERPIKVYDLDVNGHSASIAATLALPSERIVGRPRESDDVRFMQPCSVDWRELT